jgi:hypothetical protein
MKHIVCHGCSIISCEETFLTISLFEIQHCKKMQELQIRVVQREPSANEAVAHICRRKIMLEKGEVETAYLTQLRAMSPWQQHAGSQFTGQRDAVCIVPERL